MMKSKWFETRVSGINGYLKGRKVQLATGSDGVPLDPFWKARFEEKGIVSITPVKRVKADKIETKVFEKIPVEKTSDKKPVKGTRKNRR